MREYMEHRGKAPRNYLIKWERATEVKQLGLFFVLSSQTHKDKLVRL